MSACPVDGSVRTVTDRDSTSVVWHCPWCGGVTREVHDPVREALQGNFVARSHPSPVGGGRDV